MGYSMSTFEKRCSTCKLHSRAVLCYYFPDDYLPDEYLFDLSQKTHEQRA